MKKMIFVVLFFVVHQVAAQNAAIEDTTGKSAITAVGKPDGERT